MTLALLLVLHPKPTGETFTIDGVEIPVDRLGIVTGRETPTLPPEFFRNEAAMRRAMQ